MRWERCVLKLEVTEAQTETMVLLGSLPLHPPAPSSPRKDLILPCENVSVPVSMSKLHDVIRPLDMRTASVGFSYPILCLVSVCVEDLKAEETGTSCLGLLQECLECKGRPRGRARAERELSAATPYADLMPLLSHTPTQRRSHHC